MHGNCLLFGYNVHISHQEDLSGQEKAKKNEDNKWLWWCADDKRLQRRRERESESKNRRKWIYPEYMVSEMGWNMEVWLMRIIDIVFFILSESLAI